MRTWRFPDSVFFVCSTCLASWLCLSLASVLFFAAYYLFSPVKHSCWVCSDLAWADPGRNRKYLKKKIARLWEVVGSWNQ